MWTNEGSAPYLLVTFLSFVAHNHVNGRIVYQKLNSSAEWPGRWFPDTPKSNSSEWGGRWFPDAPPSPQISLLDSLPGMRVDLMCDDGVTGIGIDWSDQLGESMAEFMCDKGIRFFLKPNVTMSPVEKHYIVPKAFKAHHICINQTITYGRELPTFGPHRLVWPIYGEYKFLPPQRWLHSLEHGGVAALYHPCASRSDVSKLKNYVRNCLYRHVITPSRRWLNETYPYALVTWGSVLMLPYPHRDAIESFIKENALRGPEDISREGNYSKGLIHAASKFRSNDQPLCS